MKTIKLLTASAVILSCLATTPAHAEKKSESGSAKSKMSVSASEFIITSNSSNLYEIATSQLAMKRSRDPEVRNFAEQMIRDHSKASANLNVAVQNSNAPNALPRNFTPAHAAKYNMLNAASSSEFDAMYVKAQKEAHAEAVALFSNYSSNGDDKSLRDFAKQTLPTLEAHNEHVNGLNVSTAAK